MIIAAALLFVWPIPGTIALRHSLLITMVAAVFLSQSRDFFSARKVLSSTGPQFFPLFLFIGWIILAAAAWSPESRWSLHEISGQWPRPLLSGALGACIAAILISLTANKRHPEYWPIFFLVTVFGLQLVAHWIDITYHAYIGGVWFKISHFFGTRLNVSYACNTFAGMIIAIAIYSITQKEKSPPYLKLALVLALFITIATTVVLDTRNGYIGLSLLLVAAGSFTFLVYGRKNFKYITLGLAVIALLISLTLTLDPRWKAFIETAEVALDIDNHDQWRRYHTDQELPKTRSGAFADESAYMRITGIRASLKLATEYPLGYGFGRNAFGHATKSIYGEGRGNSHSGLSDILVGTGFVGLGLWLWFIGSLLWLSIKRLRTTPDPSAIVLFFVTSGFLGRSLLDSNIRDFSLEVFLFMAGFLCYSTLAASKNPDARQ